MSKSNFQYGFWMNPVVAGRLFDLCKGSKELLDDEGNKHPCVGCRGCKPELAVDINLRDYDYKPR